MKLFRACFSQVSVAFSAPAAGEADVDRRQENQPRKPNSNMNLRFSILSISLFCLGLAVQAQPKPLVAAHAHNDYAHQRPLFDALDCGFCSVEADIYLVDGQLLVAHDRKAVKPGRTLQSLYLDPLRERVKRNGGRVFPDGPEFTLLIDLKADWKTIYPVLRGVLTNYADVLSTFRDGAKQTNAITIILTGDRSREMFAGESTRYAAFDGDLSDLDSDASIVAWISSQWGQTFQWRGQGEMPEGERAQLKDIVTRAHARGRRVRFWGAPDFVAFWRGLQEAGVDLINTDDLKGAQAFLSAK